jgi:hypothetical protein
MKNRISFSILFLALFHSGLLSAQSNPTSWSIIASYTISGKASGLAWDGTYIYYGIYGSSGNQIYKFDPSNGNSNLQCTGPFNDAFGLTYKNPDLVTISQPSSSAQPAQSLEFTMSGTQVTTITLPDHYMSGIAYDNGDYWVCTYYSDPGLVYKINSSGTVLSQFVPPNNQPWDICLQGSDLWIADYYGNMLYKVSQTGTLLDSHASQGIKPSGIVYDGTYLWYCDGELGSNSTLYKVDLLGSGTPEITVPVISYDYGTVTIGSNSTWNCQVQNTGTANLIITNVSIPSGAPITTSFSVPATVTPGSSVNIPLTFTPVTPGSMSTQVTIVSNDPINPTVDVSLSGNGVYSGPHILLSDTTHDYGDRRAGAYSRWFLTITNNGNQPLSINNVTSSSPNFIIDAGLIFPITLATLDQAKIGIWFHPTEGTYYDSDITIASNAQGQNILTVAVQGTGVDTLYPMGTVLWNYMITAGSDNSPKAIEPIQDITGDSIEDVLVASEDDYIRCFNGNASVSADVMWEKYVYAGAVYNQNSLVTIDDINNDGYRDVIAGIAWGDRSIIALSGKTGEVLWKHDTHEYGGGGWVYQVDARYDYNNDGFPDVLAATGDDGSDTGPLRVYCLNGKTGLSIWEDPVGGPVFSVIGVEDFTGDGKPDVVAGASNQQETQGRVYGINGSTGVTFWTYYPSGTSVWALMQIDDINNDGIKDIAAGDYAGNILFLNAVNGNKLLNMNIGNVLILRFENMGDVNNDGHPDIIVGHSGTNGVIINGYNCTSLWSVPLADKSWNVANIGDVSWDGTNDAIIGTLYQNNYAYFLDGSNGNILKSLPVTTPVDAINAIPDIVGDGTMEMMIGGRNGTLVCVSGGYDPTTGIGNDDHKSGKVDDLVIYPNPGKGPFTLKLTLQIPSAAEISLLDLYGKSISTMTTSVLPAGVNTLTVDTPSDAAGVYFIQVTTNRGLQKGKVVVLK